jgi:NADH:ubiquinone oxidoreductase subunit K
MAQHHSITLHGLHLSENRLGVIAVIGIAALFALSVFHIFWFILGTVALAIALCAFLFRWHRQHKLEFNDLSMLEDLKEKPPKP